MKLQILHTLFYLSCSCGTIIPQRPFTLPNESSSIVSDSLIKKIEQLRTKWGVKGISIGLAASPNSTVFPSHSSRNDWILETLSFGEADRYGNEVSSDTRFAIASNSKLFTALAVGLLVENKTSLPNGDVLDWSTKVKDILPEWKLMDEYASDHVDLIDLGTMRSGMPRHDYSHDNHTEPKELVANMRNLRPSSEIRKDWQYNNHHYVTLALIVERLSGFTLPEYVKSHIIDPLGLISTTYNSTEALESGNRSDSFLRTGVDLQACEDSIEQEKEKLDPKCLGYLGSVGWWTDSNGLFEAGPGGVIMSANDMAKWVKELLSPEILPPSVIDTVVTGYSIMEGNPKSLWPKHGIKGYGLGQWIYNYRDEIINGHSGSLPGQQSYMVRIPKLQLGFMIAINDDIFGALLNEIITNMILEDFLGPKDHLDRKHIDWENWIYQNQIIVPQYKHLPKYPQSFKGIIEGDYHDNGYGNLNLLKFQLPNSSDEMKNSYRQQRHHHHLSSIVESSVLFDNSQGSESVTPILNVTGPIYLAEVNKLFITSILFTHFNGQLFNWTTIYTRDKLDETDNIIGKINQVIQTGTAIFTEEGVGMFGNFWGKGNTAKDSKVDEENVKENAEVWFDKL
ncbi:uncharacterized protein L201_005898 [Kwoniella dendrophila CBS 6074]|uniref:Beta-lactamase-related domain-containing protein n=1 Tax=Kwoniella dendrophila CBS 6074 TaxID=1295534 RepID=A0AAX4K2A2_9TREE